jgi:hypothetical protein
MKDLDYFFWLEGKLYGYLGDEAKELGHKARRIKICKPDPENWQIEYEYDETDRLLGFGPVPASAYVGKRCVRANWLDLSRVRVGRSYDKGAGRNLIRDFKRYYFPDIKRVTRKRWEEFFKDERNFVGLWPDRQCPRTRRRPGKAKPPRRLRR